MSYFFAGKEEFNFELALEKMKKIFNVETVILRGGPTVNGLFYERDLVDEVNLVIFPCSGSGDDSVGIFGKRKFIEFDLIGLKNSKEKAYY